jgi:hypothetical protein
MGGLWIYANWRIYAQLFNKKWEKRKLIKMNKIKNKFVISQKKNYT